MVMERVEAVRRFRQASRSAPTQNLARTPTRWHVETVPVGRYLLIPRHTSERRSYIPMGYIEPTEMTGDSCLVVADCTLFHFGVMSSVMHMAWVRQVCGRLESRYRYSAKLVYNNYPWPQDMTDAKRERVEVAAQAVLDARGQFPDATLADLYDPNAMPAVLRRAHDALDRAVDRCYRQNRFETERQRLEFLFELYRQLIEPLMPSRRRNAGRRR